MASPTNFSIIPIASFATVGAGVTTSIPLTLTWNGTPAATIQVLFPFGDGFIYTSLVTAAAAAAAVQTQTLTAYRDQTATVNGLVITMDTKGTQIVYQDSALATTVSSTLSPITGAASLATTPAITSSTNSSATNTQPSKPASSSTGASAAAQSESPELSAGAIAGIAIGCLLAGALLAGMILWFCWRRKKVPNSQHAHGNTYAMASQEKGFSVDTTAVSGKGLMGAGSRTALPQPLEDKAISGDISKISNAIKNHVQSYYHTSRVTPGLIDYDDLHALGSNLPISVGTLTTLLGNAATREIALRFIIAWVLVSKLQPSKDPSKSLLPSELAQCYQVIATGDRGHQAQASLMARWRVMTAELMQPSYVRNPFSPSDSRHASIQATLAVLDNVLQPYADSRMNNGERKRNLEEVLKRAALFAFTLFSQPSVWEFKWQEEQGVTSGELCIFPALVQVADEAGHPVSPPRPFSEAVVRRLDS